MFVSAAFTHRVGSPTRKKTMASVHDRVASAADAAPELRTARGEVSRRSILRGSAAAGLGIVFLGSVEAIAGCAPAPAAAPPAPPRPPGYGPLVTDPQKILSLAEGFTYRIVAEAGVSTLSDGGEPTPSDTDGTACFATPAGLTLVNNHEIGGDEPFRLPNRDGLTYDPAAGGGTTNIEISASGERLGEYVSVAGTHNNCAGGVTP
jgi:uncharacterized protein